MHICAVSVRELTLPDTDGGGTCVSGGEEVDQAGGADAWMRAADIGGEVSIAEGEEFGGGRWGGETTGQCRGWRQ